MWAVPSAALLNVSIHSNGTVMRLTDNPILEHLDPAIPYPVALDDKCALRGGPDSEDVPIMMKDIQEAYPVRTMEEITEQALQVTS